MKKLNLALLFFGLSFALFGPVNLAGAKPSVGSYPSPYVIKVVSPNGGEMWDRNLIQKIEWKAERFFAEPLEGFPSTPMVSIDLFEERETRGPVCKPGQGCPDIALKTRVFVKHIDTVNLFDSAYSWKITPDIQNGKNYIVRIGLEEVGYAEDVSRISPGPVPPVYPIFDESDGTFAIVGQPPTNPPSINAVIVILEQIIALLQKAIALLGQSTPAAVQ